MADLNHSISVEYAREILDFDAGVFRWKWRDDRAKWWNTRFVGTVAGYLKNTGYITIRINGWNYQAHRLAWLYVHGVWPTDQLDHINGVRDDNRIANLREATSQENNRNAGLRKDNSSGITGVGWHKRRQKFQARIAVDGRLIYLGRFDTLEEAAAARAKAESFYFGEFRRNAA
jgi:hypothetical protein